MVFGCLLRISIPDLRKSTALRLLSAAGCYLASFLSSLRLCEFLLLPLPFFPLFFFLPAPASAFTLLYFFHFIKLPQ